MEIRSAEKLHSISGNAFEHAANKFNIFRLQKRRWKRPFMIPKEEGYMHGTEKSPLNVRGKGKCLFCILIWKKWKLFYFPHISLFISSNK